MTHRSVRRHLVGVVHNKSFEGSILNHLNKCEACIDASTTCIKNMLDKIGTNRFKIE